MLQSLPHTKKQLLSHFVARLSTPFLTYFFQASLMRLLKKRIMQSAEVKNCASIIAITKKQLLSHFVARSSTPFLTDIFQASLIWLLKKRIMQPAELKNCASIIAICKTATLVPFCGPLKYTVFNLFLSGEFNEVT